MTDLASPRAARLAVPRWLDARLVTGVLLVLVSVAAGARVLASADHFSTVLVARHDLVPGEHLTAGDLTVGRVRLDGQGGYYVAASGALPVGYVATRYVGAHEFVPLGALAAPTDARVATRLVTVPVAPGHLPAALDHGDLVDVYLTPKTAPGAAVPVPTLVLAAVPVEARDGGSRGFSGDATLAVVLAVPAARVADIVHAAESGTIDLVALPAAAAAAVPRPGPATSAAP